MKSRLTEKLKEELAIYEFCGCDVEKNKNVKNMDFMNDNCFVKRLEENRVRGEEYSFKEILYQDCEEEKEKVKAIKNYIEYKCIEKMCRGTNAQYAKQDVLCREDLSCNDSHCFTEEIIRRARTTLAKGHTEKINGYYILLAHSDVVYELKNKLKICNVTFHDVLIVETNNS